MSRNPVQQHTGSKSNQITKMSAYWKFGKKFGEQENYSQLSFFFVFGFVFRTSPPQQSLEATPRDAIDAYLNDDASYRISVMTWQLFLNSLLVFPP